MKKNLLKTALIAVFINCSMIANAQTWPYVDIAGTGVNTGGGNNVSGRDLLVVSDQEIYTAMHASSSDKIEIYKYDGTSWSSITNPNTSGQIIGTIS